MKQLQTLRNIVFLSALGISFISCGGGSSSSSSNVDPSTDKQSGVLVDPYIKGAVLCEDINKNGTCDEGEQTSSATNSNGVFTFENNLTAGSHIIIDTQGYHNDVPYTLDISGVVDDNGSIHVISPLTALIAKGLTPAQIVTMLQNGGLSNITEDDITANPLEGGINSLNTNNKLRKLHATLAVYGMLKTIEGSDTLNSLTTEELVTSAQIGGEVNQILTAMIGGITSALSEDTIANVQIQVDMYDNQMSTPPEVSVGVVASTAVATIDALTKIAYEACNQTDGNDSEKVENALQAFNNSKDTIFAKTADIGMRFYAKENQAYFNTIRNFTTAIPQTILEVVDNPNEAIIINTNSDSLDIARQDTDVSNVVVEAIADDTIAPFVPLTCANITEDMPGLPVGSDCDGDGYPVAYTNALHFKVAFKTLALVDSDGEKHYLIQKDSLDDSVVFDISEAKTFGDLTVPQGRYTKFYAEIYYYFLTLPLYEENNYYHLRVYMSDNNTDDSSDSPEGFHQGDIVKVSGNNKVVLGWVPAGGSWRNSVTPRPHPSDHPDGSLDNNVLYASLPDTVTNRQRGPFGGTEFWEDETQNYLNNETNEDIFYINQDINLNVTKESFIKLTFPSKYNWYWEDVNGDNVFGPTEHADPNDENETEAGGEYGTWAPLFELPQISIVE